MKYKLLLICFLILLVGCTSSYEDCTTDCIEMCMEGKEYQPVDGWSGCLSYWCRATEECRVKCYDECR